MLTIGSTIEIKMFMMNPVKLAAAASFFPFDLLGATSSEPGGAAHCFEFVLVNR
jgi:hypothetical protein